jgi:cellulose synthase/poly-beta-1,6-N-acetylglucosamine synthase-like glycosyltransferase
MTAITIFSLVFLLISAVYFLIIILITIGIFRLKKNNTSPVRQFTSSLVHHLTTVTIIIPARNEQETIAACLGDLSNQDYPAHLFEVIVVNDHSTDRTEDNVQDFARLHPSLNLRLIPTGATGNDQAFKKHSIRSGVDASSGELIITTDADTRMKPGWLSSIADLYEQRHPEMILGPVDFHEGNTFFEKLQRMEFAGLMAATAGSCSMGFPLMCNGANLAFTRIAYLETLNLNDDLRFPSGDDLFLMMKIRKKFGASSIQYLFTGEAIVSTHAKRTLKEFFSQRLRWVSKSRGFTDPVVMAVAIVTWLFNFLMLSTLVAGIFNQRLLLLSLVLLGIKMILEFPSVYRIISLSGKMKSWILYPLTQILNIVYVTLIGILGNVISYEWKGRKVNPVKRNNQG